MSSFAEFRERARAETAPRMPELFARARWSAAQLAELQRDRLRELLAVAAERSPFYARRLRGVDVAGFELSDLARVTPVSKDELMAQLDSVFTDRRLDRELVERALGATASEPAPILDRYFALATGGSSGQRGVFVYTPSSWAEVSASALRRIVPHLIAARGMPPGGLVVGTVAAASAMHATGLAAALNPPGSGPVAIVSVPVTLPLNEIVSRLNALGPQLILGYPSVLASLARERTAGRLRVEPGLVATTSEMLTPEARAAIRAGFGVPVIDAFGSTEGLMGATEPDGDAFVFNSDTCIVELVDAENQPVPMGAMAARALVTNLANPIQPLIRYQLEDGFVRQPDAEDHGHLRATVAGRADEVLRWNELEIHPLVIRAALLKHPEVADYQVRQTPCGVEVAVVADAALEPALLQAELGRALEAAGLARPRVVVARVERLERNPGTGKVRRFVPLIG